MSEPRSVSELYPSRWVKAADLNGKAVTVKVTDVMVEPVHTPGGETKTAAVLTFEGKQKRLILNKTQCRAMVAITGSEKFGDWVGAIVQLAPAKAPNGKATIAIQSVRKEDSS